VAGFVDRHVAHVGPHRQVGLDGRHDVVDALVAFVVRVIDAGGILARDEPGIQIRKIAVVDQRPVIVAVADHAHQPVAGRLEQIADDAAATAVDDPGRTINAQRI
jgi:hypothetical protein